MRRINLIVLMFVLLLPNLLLAQYSSDTPAKINFGHLLRNGNQQIQGLSSLLGIDPSRFSMKQSYMMSYGRYGGQNLSQGLYLNTMAYQFLAPITLKLQFGMAHNPMQSYGMASPFKNGLFVSGAALQYKPTENMSVNFEFSSMPQSYYYNDFSYGNRSLLRPNSLLDE